jgi:hypothetical protein
MKTIIMLGDSFGAPNWYGPPGAPPEAHVEFLLKDMKHKGTNKYHVINLSINGSSSDKHAEQLELFVYTNPLVKVDYVIWFHNASISCIVPPTVEHQLHDHIRDQLIAVYSNMLELKKRLGARWVVIGGSSPLPDFYYPSYIHDYIIHDWRAKILNENLPQVFGSGVLSNRLLINSELNTESLELKHRANTNFENIQMLLSKNKNLFPDSCHPGIKPHRDLSIELDSYFQSNGTT